MKENFPNLAKELVYWEVQEAQRVPKKSFWAPSKRTQRGTYPSTSSLSYSRLKIRREEARGRKRVSYLQRRAHNTMS